MSIDTERLVPTDGNGNIADGDWSFVLKAAPSAFDGGTTDARGDLAGALDPLTLFTVTGEVRVRVFGVCSVDLTGATATLEVGTAANTAGLIAQTTATDIDAGELWHDTTPDSDIELETVAPARLIVGGADIIETPGTANVDSGQIHYICAWYPVSPDGDVQVT